MKVTVTGGRVVASVASEDMDVDGTLNAEIYDGVCARGSSTEVDYRERNQTNRFDACASPFPHTAFDGFFIVTVKKDGRWYASITETLVEYARLALEDELAK